MNRLTYFHKGKWRMVINDVEHSGPKIDYIAAMENLIESTAMAVMWKNIDTIDSLIEKEVTRIMNDKYGITCESEGEDEDRAYTIST